MYTNRAVDVNHGKMKQRPKYTGVKDYSYDGKYSDDSGEEIDLLNRRIHKPQQFVEADILDGDTLQAIALRFNCSVAAIKKANNIHRENEIFAKRKIKIPVTAFSLLTETIPLVHTSGSNSPTKLAERALRNDNKAASITSDIDLQQKLIVASVNSAELSSVLRVQSAANSNLSINNESTSGISSINDELVNCDIAVTNFNRESAPLLMVAPSKSTTVEDVVLNEFASKGADFGLKWVHLLLFVLILGVFIPLFYVFYIAEHPEKYLHHHNK